MIERCATQPRDLCGPTARSIYLARKLGQTSGKVEQHVQSAVTDGLPSIDRAKHAHAALDPNHHHRERLPSRALFSSFSAAFPTYKGADNMRTYNKPEVSTVSRMTSALLILTALRRPCFLRPNYACRHSVTPIVFRLIALGSIID